MARVLIVDDDDALRRALGDRLRFWNHSVEEASDAATGARLGKAGAYELVLLDLSLPDGSGLDVLAEVKPQRPKLYAIVLSNFAGQKQYRDASLAAGADIVLDKTREFARVREILRGRLAASPR